MLEKVHQIAEKTAANVSRRQFLGRFGRSATAAAAGLGAFLAFPGLVLGGRKPKTPVVCGLQSEFICTNRYVGDTCGRGSKCVADDSGNCRCGKPGKGNSPKPK